MTHNDIPFQCPGCPFSDASIQDFCPACECKAAYVKGKRHIFRLAERFRQCKQARSLVLGEGD